MEIVLLTKKGMTINKTINSCTNVDGVDISKNITAKTARGRFNKDLQCYVFSVSDFNKEMAEAEKYKLF